SHISSEETQSFIRLILAMEKTRHNVITDLARVGYRILHAGPTQQIQASDLAK
ncbi:hypothetical protein HK102_010693, partial [Quaeritorhiza haematococci]